MAELFCPKCRKTMKDDNFYTYKMGQNVNYVKLV